MDEPKGRSVTYLQKGMKPIKSFQPDHKSKSPSKPQTPLLSTSANGNFSEYQEEIVIRLALEFVYPNHLFPTQILYVDRDLLTSESAYFRQLYKDQILQDAKRPSIKIHIGDLQKIIGN